MTLYRSFWIVTFVSGFASSCKPVITFSAFSKEPELDGQIRLDCEVNVCDLGVQLQWRKWTFKLNGEKDKIIDLYYYNNDSDKGALDGTPDYNIKGRTDHFYFAGLHALIINDLIIKDNGTWECVATTPSDGLDVIIPVRAISANITISPSNPPIVDGQIAEFQCRVSGVNPIPLVYWKVGGVRNDGGQSENTIVNDYWSVTNTIQLNFPNTGAVEVNCAVGEVGEICRSEYIDVKERSKIVGLVSDEEFQVDETLSLTCEASGFMPLISWVKNDSYINADDPMYNITAEGTTSQLTSTLTSLALDSPYTCDNVTTYGGTYKCVAKLAEPYQHSSDISNSSVITILYSPISGPDHSQERGIGDTDIVLMCEICASKILSDKWLFYGNDTEHRVLQDGSLSIDRITATSFGNYTRVVTNSLGTGKCSVVLIHNDALDVESGLSETEIAGIIIGCLIFVAAVSISLLLAKRYKQHKQKGPKIPHIYENGTIKSHDETSQNATGLYELDENVPTQKMSQPKGDYAELDRTGQYNNAGIYVYEVLNK